jgi:hypothetical protein
MIAPTFTRSVPAVRRTSADRWHRAQVDALADTSAPCAPGTPFPPSPSPLSRLFARLAEVQSERIRLDRLTAHRRRIRLLAVPTVGGEEEGTQPGTVIADSCGSFKVQAVIRH